MKAIDEWNADVFGISMEACYINTAHPDFLNGHQAIAMVNDQLAPKNQPSQHQQHPNDALKSSKQMPALQTSATNSPDPDGGSFFGSFFSGPKKTKKTAGMMEAVSNPYRMRGWKAHVFFISIATHVA